MKLAKIISMANRNTELRFRAMERSLRATGCNLPLWVIPYDNNTFELPENASWWEVPEVIKWLQGHNCRGVYRKYQCLLTADYQFVDADVIFLRDPAKVLEHEQGFITSCGHWHNPGQTYTTESLEFFRHRSTTWQKNVFNTGQFACDRELYSFGELKRIAESPEYKPTALDFRFHEQPGINQLVNGAGAQIHNLTMHGMQSTWAGDYEDENYQRYWKNETEKPYIIHWAGCRMDTGRPIDKLFLDFLTAEEKSMWLSSVEAESRRKNTAYKRFRRYLSSLKMALKEVKY